MIFWKILLKFIFFHMCSRFQSFVLSNRNHRSLLYSLSACRIRLIFARFFHFLLDAWNKFQKIVYPIMYAMDMQTCIAYIEELIWKIIQGIVSISWISFTFGSFQWSLKSDKKQQLWRQNKDDTGIFRAKKMATHGYSW